MAPGGFTFRYWPRGPWRFGSECGAPGLADIVLHSDAVYAAVTHAMNLLGLLRDWLEAVFEDPAGPAVRFSSLFPFHHRTLFVAPPRTLWPPAPSSKVRWKGARLIPLSAVRTLASRQVLEEDAWLVDGESQCLVPAADPTGPFKVSVRSFAAVDRLGAGVEVHRAACLEFRPGAGIWGAVRFASEEAKRRWSEPVQAALRLLADSGLGGKRSLGWGHAAAVEFEEEAPEGQAPDSVTVEDHQAASGTEAAWWLLSVFSPAADEDIDWRRGNYTLIVRSGRISSPAAQGELKRATRLIGEGSVLVAGAAPRGRALDVAPAGSPHPVYRASYAFALPIPRAS
jgi:CRISPR type III-A-associated RAMP protein Csm4